MNDANTKDIGYAQAIERIQEIIALLNDNSCDIDRMLDYVTEASELIKSCREKLARTGLKIQETLADLSNTNSTP